MTERKLNFRFSSVPGFPAALAQTRDQNGIASVRLSVAGHDDAAVDVVWEKHDVHDGVLDIGLDSALFPFMAVARPPALILAVRAAPRAARVVVRQRSVSYLEVSDEGPHMSVPGSEQRSAWRALTAFAPGRYRVEKTIEQKVKMGHELFARVFADDPHWRQLALACKGPNEGACGTNTDIEFDVKVTDVHGRVTRKMFA